jgi:hypothetical protein
MELKHEGSFNFLVNHNSKNLAIQAKDGENAIVTVPDGAVQLYFDNVLKAETTSVGFNVQGIATQETTGDDVVWGRQVFRDQIGSNATRTITISGVIYGNATVSLGYSDGNAQFVTYKALMGGAQYSLQNGYTVTEQINSRSGVNSISVTKNNASFVITIVAGTNAVFGSVVVESHNYTSNGRPTVAFA